MDEQDFIALSSNLTLPKTIIELPTKSYDDSLHENSRTRRDLSRVFNGQGNDLNDNKLISLDSITVNGIPSSDIELANKKYVDLYIGGDKLGFNQTLQNYSNSLVKMTHIILPSTKNYNLLILQLSNWEMDLIFYLNGKLFATIKVLLEKQQILYEQRNIYSNK